MRLTGICESLDVSSTKGNFRFYEIKKGLNRELGNHGDWEVDQGEADASQFHREIPLLP